MTDEPLFRVTLPNGRKTKPYSRRKIREALTAGRLPAGSVVALNDLNIPIDEFCGTTDSDLSLSAEHVQLPPPTETRPQPRPYRMVIGGLTLLAGLSIGFLLGMEYSRRQQLMIGEDELPGLKLDQALYTWAAERAENNGLEGNAKHFRATLHEIDSRLSQTEEND